MSVFKRTIPGKSPARTHSRETLAIILVEMTRTITNKLLWINLFLILILIVIAIFWTEIGLTDSKNVYLGLTAVIIYGFSISGVFVGIIERKNKKYNTSLGIIGNSILTTIFLVLFIYATIIMDV